MAIQDEDLTRPRRERQTRSLPVPAYSTTPINESLTRVSITTEEEEIDQLRRGSIAIEERSFAEKGRSITAEAGKHSRQKSEV